VSPAVFPWQARPAGSSDVVWRYSQNPIIPHDAIPTSNSIFNSAVVVYEGGYAGVFRCDSKTRQMQLHAGRSRDGFDWQIEPERIAFQAADARIGEIAAFEHAYDPRVTWLEDRYYVTWCNGYHGPTIGLGYTHDFSTFYQM
jgi:beta-1,4-mannooligosaccharide/beta-1,4-mannosyl-N-acetylglucosamine phosphorylase